MDSNSGATGQVIRHPFGNCAGHFFRANSALAKGGENFSQLFEPKGHDHNIAGSFAACLFPGMQQVLRPRENLLYNGEFPIRDG